MRGETGRGGLTCGAVAGRRTAAAFTLLELLTVIAIIAVLSALAIGAGRHAVEAGKNARAKAELAALAVALDAYRQATGDYPRMDSGALMLQALIGRRDPSGAVISGPTVIALEKFSIAGGDPLTDVTALLLDPWGQPYRYAYKSQTPWTNSSFVLWSVGPEGADSGVLLPGGYADRAAIQNLDNIYANGN